MLETVSIIILMEHFSLPPHAATGLSGFRLTQSCSVRPWQRTAILTYILALANLPPD